MAGEISMAFTLVSVERGRIGTGGAFSWLAHNTSDQFNDLGAAIWVKDASERLCRFVYCLSAETLAANDSVSQVGADPWAAASDQFKVVKGGNVTTGGAGLNQLAGMCHATFNSGRYGWIQTHGPGFGDNIGPTIDAGSSAVVACETYLNAPAKADKGKCAIHLETHTAPPFAVVIKTETTATPEVLLFCTVF